MKKFLFILLPLLSFCFFLAKSSFALDVTPTLSTPAPSSATGVPNPAPPIGIPCGKTMCLAGEICTTYPNESDPHCVPAPIDHTTLPDCESVLPGGAGQGTFPPSIKCWNHFTNAQSDLSLYKRTCIYEPVASYGDKRKLKNGAQPFSMCGKGDSGPGGPAAPGGNDPACDIHMLVDTSVKAAQVGGYGPDANAVATYSSEFISQNYLYNSLFDRPSDLNDVNPKKNTDGYSIKNREAYRTYWRLMPASSQANLRSFVMNMANEKQINNINFNFIDQFGTSRKTSFTELYSKLKAQVILFWHFPFIRVGCLTSYPVCPEYAQAIAELKPGTEDLLIVARRFNLGFAVDGLINTYNAIINSLGYHLNAPYDAFVPLDFDSVRGYILKKKDDIEQTAYDQYSVLRNDTANGFNGFRLTNVSAENIPYVGAIYQGLLSPKFGMIPALQPQWLIDKYATPEAELISDYKTGNSTQDFPEIKIYRKNFFDQLQDETAAIFTDPLGWLNKKIQSFFSTSDKLKGYTDNRVDNKKDDIVNQYTNMQMCPMPVSYHLVSAKTADKYINPENNGEAELPDDHHQIITIPGNKLDWSYTPKCESITPTCKPDPITGIIQCNGGCNENDETYVNGDQCCTRAWSVSGIKHGKSLTVLNNPKQTDIKQAVAGNDSISFYKMLLPDGTDKPIDAGIDAPIAEHLNTQGDGLVTAPNGKGSILNPAEPINRENNLAQDSMHYLQNCWTVPKDLQNSPRCKPSSVIPPAAGCGVDPVLNPIPSCQIKNNSLHLPDSLIKGIEVAAKTFSVPPALLVGIMYGEGAFNPGSQFMDEAVVKQNFQSCTTLPDCSPTASVIKNIVPFFPNYWDNLKDAVKTFDPTREPNACNLLDGIFALAKDISQSQYGSSAFAGKSCFGISLNANTPGTGSHSCTWDENDVETAIRVWEFGTAYSSTLSCATKQNSCLLGGGLAAQCPTGDDSCETKSSRYPGQASHNACVWDIYSSN